MITFTDGAKQKVLEYMEQSEGDFVGLRLVAMKQGRHTFSYNFSLVSEGETYDADQAVDLENLKVFMDAQSAEFLDEASVDFVSDPSGAGFKVENPLAVAHWDDPLAEKVQHVIDEQVLPAVRGHGGWVELLEIEGDTAVIEFGGGCQGCGMSQVTLKEGIEKAITGAVPEIKSVIDKTDHAAGSDPYHAG
ncbi:MAG: iron-sulfur cluster assembly accessory protein [bacterium]|nr:iron-sulfur cluster assembly accessory protein [bacterium]